MQHLPIKETLNMQSNKNTHFKCVLAPLNTLYRVAFHTV